MSLIDDLLTIVGSPQWNFVYNALALFGLAATLAMAWGHWRRSQQVEARRLVIGCAILFFTRLLLPLAISLIPGLGDRASTLLQPLERALDTMAIVVIGWMFLAPPGAVWSAPFLGLQVGLIVLAGAALTRQWAQDVAATPALSYGGSWQRFLWAGWQIALCVFLGYMALRSRRYARQAGYLFSLFFVLLAGQALELAIPFKSASFPVWERLSVLLTTGLLAFIVYKVALAEARSPADAPLPPISTSNSFTETLLTLFDDARYATDRPPEKADAELDEMQLTLIERAARVIAQALEAEQVAIGLLEGTQEDRMHLAAVHNPRRRGRGGVVSFPLDEQLAIRRSLRQRKMAMADGAEDVIQIKFLYALMGSEETGPLLIQPMVYQDRLVGAIIAGNGATKRPISADATRLAPMLAEVIALIVMAPRLARQAEDKLRKAQQTTSEREAEWNRRLDILANELQHERDSAQLFAQRLTELQQEGQQKSTETDHLQRRLAQQEEETSRSQQEAIALSKKLESLTLAKVILEDEVQGYRDQIQNLEHLLGERQQ